MAGEDCAASEKAAATRAPGAPAAPVQIYAASANAAFADKIAAALDAEGFPIVTGQFEGSGAAAVVVVWSGTAIGSKRLLEAAEAPLRRGVLVPVSIGRIEPPDRFKGLAPVDLSNWSGATTDPRWRMVVDAILRATGRPSAGGGPAAAPVGAPAAGHAEFLTWFDAPYTEDDRPKRPPAPLAPPLPAPRRARRASPALLAGFGVVGAALFAGLAFIPGAEKASRSLPAPPPLLAARPDAAPSAAGAAPLLAKIRLAPAPPEGGAVVPAESPAPKAGAGDAAPRDAIAELIVRHAATEAGGEAAAEAGADAGDALAGPAPPAASSPFRDCPACPELAVIPAGAFVMGGAGATARRSQEGPQVAVEIARPFALARRETTVAEWRACVAAAACPPAPETGWPGNDLPVTNVSWADANAYAAWLSQTTGKSYRLPSEAEWEYAARAGAKTSFSFGATLSARDASFDGSLPLGGASGPAQTRPRPVASYPANAFGLFDMHGNVWEWTADCWSASHRGAPADGAPRGGDCRSRVIKGGAWNSGGWRLRAEHRLAKNAAAREFDNGFRVARDFP